MNKTIAFNNQLFGQIRTQLINGQIYFVAADVTRLLGYSDIYKAIKRYCHDRTFCPVIDAKGRPQQTNIITESDLYRLVVNSKMPNAKKFERWVFEEVLPSIRQKGEYKATTLPVHSIPSADNLFKLKELRLKEAEILLKIAGAKETSIRERKSLRRQAAQIILQGERHG